jgi:hypothetical protein
MSCSDILWYCLEKRVSCVNFFLFWSFNEIFFMKTEIMNIHFLLLSPKHRYLVRVNFLCDIFSSFCFKFNPIWPAWKRYFFLDYNYILEEVMLLTVHGWSPKPEYINARQLCNQLMEQYVGKLHILLRLCEILLAKHHTTYNNSSRSILIVKSKNMARISNDFYELLLLIHWYFGDIFL